jgi:drug/metabolite transporter (DMT)-like permease
MPSADQPRNSDRRGRLPRLNHATESYLLLVFTTACWGGNAVAGRLVVGQVSPMIVTSLRWAMVSLFLAFLGPGRIIAAWPEIRRSWRRIVIMAACGFSFFNALFYFAAHYTTAVNISILQGAIPVFVVLGAVVIYRTRLGTMQIAGIATTLVGIAVVATQGHISALAALRLNRGDAMMLVACALYAGYTLALRDRPAIPALVFFTALAVIAFLTSLPLVAYEIVDGTAQWPTTKGWLVLLFIALFPSFLAQLAFMRGVRLIGPGRAGLFANLVPIFGALFAVITLGEAFALYHLAALVLVTGGILLAEISGRRREAAAVVPPA